MIDATLKGQNQLVRQILKKDNSPNERDSQGETALTWASHFGHTSIVKDLLAIGADREAYGNTLKGTPLLLAARGGHRGIVALLAVLANLNAHNQHGQTALMLAVEPSDEKYKPQHRILATVDLLIQAGADLDLRDFTGNTALMWAVRWGNHEVTQRLLAAGANPNFKNDHGQTALQLADDQGLTKIVSLLNTVGAFD
ncbi:MAG: ankyrin repeat domain-containing protein [Anaerolineae bacterium]|nr:ankyrin repeat domain-containing protein [Anaerolineae bacterium]